MNRIIMLIEEIKKGNTSWLKIWNEIKEMMIRFVLYIGEYIKIFAVSPFSKLLLRNRHIYLIAERGDDARDNGEYMFRYYREKHPEIEAYYVITKNSPDRSHLEPYGNLITTRSFRHYFYFFGAEKYISTHLLGCAPDGAFYMKYRRKHKLKGAVVSIKHGITKDDLPALYYKNARLDLLIAGAKPEYEYMRSCFGYDDKHLRYTGFARFDGLHNVSTKNQILIMPTWRRGLSNTPDREFKNTAYARAWNSVLNNSRLIRVLQEREIQIIFYPHYELQKYIYHFSHGNNNIIIADFEHYDVQTLLKESKLLITDFSSVFFDFAYMLKPTLYYQFDHDEFFANHYKKGYFEYETSGFGKVLYKEEELIDEILHSLETGMTLEPEYKDRILKFFQIRDNKNCERIFEAIEETLPN